jgi:ribonuclease H2 subunit A
VFAQLASFLSPQAISSGMLRRPPINLNRQSEDATILLIREVLASGIKLAEVYVDALGPTKAWEETLSSRFPGISFTVTAKADSKFKIVGAASVAAKVTRDAWIDGWVFEEAHRPEVEALDGAVANERRWGEAIGSGYPSGELGYAYVVS